MAFNPGFREGKTGGGGSFTGNVLDDGEVHVQEVPLMMAMHQVPAELCHLGPHTR
jgi:hypothetical protein